MKKLNYLLLVLLAVSSLTSCKKLLDELLTFSFSTSSDFTIPGTIAVNTPLSINTPEISASSSAEFGNNGTNPSLVKDVKLSKMSLTITSPSGQNFDFLSEIKIYINAEGLNEVLIASKTDIPDTEDNMLDLNTEDVALEEYIKKDKFSLRLDVKTDKTITQEVNITSNMTFSVTADPL